jgi:hypothetical protein
MGPVGHPFLRFSLRAKTEIPGKMNHVGNMYHAKKWEI